MAKPRTVYVCQECGRKSPKAMGRCPQCGSWNSMVEEIEQRGASGKRARRASPAEALRLSEIEAAPQERWPLGIGELSRVLGGGVVPGSVVLIGGDPGIGKSTLLLQAALHMAASAPVLYVSGEESQRQIRGRWARLGGSEEAADRLFLASETNLESIESLAARIAPRALVIDSVQTVQSDDLDSAAGTISQVRETASRLQILAKSSGMAVFLVGHVTKEGAIAGPRVLEHIVDTVLYLEGDRYHAFRLLRSVKNRFGATTEVGVFEMRADGLKEVTNPSLAFLAERDVNAPGSAVAVTLEGTRPLLVEIQGLTSPTAFGNPRRTANGLDVNRLLLVLAVLTRRVGIRLSDQDVFANVVGGMRIGEPAADLALAAALASSQQDRPLPADTVFLGEIGLSGELRSVPRLDARMREAAKLGFRRALIPRASHQEDAADAGLEVIRARSVAEALHAFLSHPAPAG